MLYRITSYFIATCLSIALSQTTFAAQTTVNPEKKVQPSFNLLNYYNRNVYGFNQGFDAMLFKPAAKAYNAVTPYPIQKGVSNFFANVAQIPTIINDVLQADPKQALSDTWRLAVNSTLGVGGLFDVAEHMGLPPHKEDLGLTFATWGWKKSRYFVIPILGPSTFRDALAILPNYYLFTVYPHIKPARAVWALIVADAISYRASFLGFEGVRKNAAFDPYVFEKNAYLQRRNFLIEENIDHGDDSWIDEGGDPEPVQKAPVKPKH
ncbi:MAG: ABC transporter [marine bacterium B5-7]|nr:MAG: ABC transporter [marine bacterium B5-7]